VSVSAFDARRRVLSGDPIPIVEPMDANQFAARGENGFSVSDTGVLVLGFTPDYEPVWFDRQGRSIFNLFMGDRPMLQ
jgi:hypothetical protein